MLMICFVMIVTPFELAFVSAVGWSKNYTPFPNKYTGLFITNWTVNLLFIVDIIFNFLTAVYDPQLNKWLLRFDQIALHYARGWMALDVFGERPSGPSKSALPEGLGRLGTSEDPLPHLQNKFVKLKTL